MGFFDLISDVFSYTSVDAESPKGLDTGDEHNSSKDGKEPSNAQQSGRVPVSGGVSQTSPAAGTDEESDEEAEVNKADKSSGGSAEPGHKPGSGKQEIVDVKADEPEEEEEEEEEEPVDPKETLEEGKSTLIFTL
jgi:ubiquinol-cytochrome c reductase subunit 6